MKLKLQEIELKHQFIITQLNEEISSLKIQLTEFKSQEKDLNTELHGFKSKITSYKFEMLQLIEVIAELVEARNKDASYLDSRASSPHHSIDHNEEGKL